MAKSAIKKVIAIKATPKNDVKQKIENTTSDKENETFEIAEKIAAMGIALNVNLDLSLAELINSATARLNAASVQVALAGIELLSAKANSPHGEFAKYMKAAKISDRQARYSMSIARWLLHLPKDSAVSVLNQNIPPTKLRELARLDPAELLEMEAENGTDLDGLLANTQRDLVDMVQKYKRQSNNLEVQLEQKDFALKNAGGGEAWKERTVTVQRQLSAIHGEVSIRIEDLVLEVENWQPPPASVHGRHINSQSGAVREHFAALARELESARANVETALLKIEKSE